MAGSKRRSSRQVAKRSIYAEPDTDDEDFEFEYGRRQSTEDIDEYHAEPEAELPAPKRRKTAATRRKPQTRSSGKSTQSTLKAAFRIGKPRKSNSKAFSHRIQEEEREKSKVFSGPSDGKIPDWTALPMLILQDIFTYATLPADGGIVRSDLAWLFRTARTCRAFARPALEAYYHSPTLYASQHMHDFLDLLQPRTDRYLDYNVKVMRLDVDVRGLAYVAPGKPAFDLSALMRQLPRMQHMEIHHPEHVAPFRPVKVGRWTFNPTQLFQAMDDTKMRLKTWRWSRNLISNDSFVNLYEMMAAAHERKMFAGLERLVVCGFNVSDSAEPTVEEEGVLCSCSPNVSYH